MTVPAKNLFVVLPAHRVWSLDLAGLGLSEGKTRIAKQSIQNK